jgi:hypothetical protein
MKTIIITVSFTLSATFCLGQKMRFSDTSNKWTYCQVTVDDPLPFVHSFYFIGDTIIGSYSYRKTSGYSSLIREDTLAGKVYIRFTDTTLIADTGDLVLYDYNWHNGDTVRQPKNSISGISPKSWVAGIDSTVINGFPYKVWHFAGPAPYYVIEGVGSTNGFIFAVRPEPFFEVVQCLRCFVNHGVSDSLSLPVPVMGVGVPSLSYFDNFHSCGYPVEVSIVTSNELIIYPNPVQTTLNISAPHPLVSVVIYNIFCEPIIESENLEEKVQIDVKGLPAGIYIARINGAEVKRFVKQ